MASCVMQPPNQDEQAKLLQAVAERSSRILGDFAQKQAASLSSAMRDELGIAKAFMDLYSHAAMDPSVLASASVNWWIDSMQLWQSTWMKMLGAPRSEEHTSELQSHDNLVC